MGSGSGIEQKHPIIVGFDTNCHYHHLYYNVCGNFAEILDAKITVECSTTLFLEP